MLVVDCLLWLVCEVWVWLVIWWYGFDGMSDRPINTKRSLTLMTFFISGCPIEDRSIRNIYNPKHYIAETLPERRPLESFHKALISPSPSIAHKNVSHVEDKSKGGYY